MYQLFNPCSLFHYFFFKEFASFHMPISPNFKEIMFWFLVNILSLYNSKHSKVYWLQNSFNTFQLPPIIYYIKMKERKRDTTINIWTFGVSCFIFHSSFEFGNNKSFFSEDVYTNYFLPHFTFLFLFVLWITAKGIFWSITSCLPYYLKYLIQSFSHIKYVMR